MKEDLFQLGAKAIIRNNEGKILLMNADATRWGETNDRPHWDLPGGRLKKGDNLEQTLIREVEEETGIQDIKILDFFTFDISKVRFKDHPDTPGLILFIYLCESPHHNVTLSHEHLEWKWFTPEDAAPLLENKYASAEFALKLKTLK